MEATGAVVESTREAGATAVCLRVLLCCPVRHADVRGWDENEDGGHGDGVVKERMRGNVDAKVKIEVEFCRRWFVYIIGLCAGSAPPRSSPCWTVI